MNHIPRNFKSITATFNSGNAKGVRMIITKDKYGYHVREVDSGKMWSIFPSHLRISELVTIEKIEC